jgi:hypothetical protein
MTRTTMTTVKSFVKKNQGKLFINKKSSFNGMVDGCDYHKNSQFEAVIEGEDNHNNTLGIKGAWFVRDGGDLVKPYEDSEYMGFEVYNCCGSFLLAVKK